jgi:hypothetical protein
VNSAIERVVVHQSCQPRKREYQRQTPKQGSHPHGDYWLCFLYNCGENVKTCMTLAEIILEVGGARSLLCYKDVV